MRYVKGFGGPHREAVHCSAQAEYLFSIAVTWYLKCCDAIQVPLLGCQIAAQKRVVTGGLALGKLMRQWTTLAGS